MTAINLHGCIVAQAFAEPGDEHIEAAAHEVVVVAPDSPQNIVAPDERIGMGQQVSQHIGFALSERLGGSTADKLPADGVELIATNGE